MEVVIINTDNPHKFKVTNNLPSFSISKMSKQTSILHDWIVDYNVKCNCNRGNIQLFYCNVESCKDHAQTFFCSDCIIFDRKHENHDRVPIKNELEQKNIEWRSLVENINSLQEIIEENYYQYQYLIKYLDNENILKTDFTVKDPSHNVDKDV